MTSKLLRIAALFMIFYMGAIFLAQFLGMENLMQTLVDGLPSAFVVFLPGVLSYSITKDHDD